MRIGIIGSMQFSEKMLEIQAELVCYGHDAFVTKFAAPMVGKIDTEKERMMIEQK